jgi:hypothetical protein
LLLQKILAAVWKFGLAPKFRVTMENLAAPTMFKMEEEIMMSFFAGGLWSSRG